MHLLPNANPFKYIIKEGSFMRIAFGGYEHETNTLSNLPVTASHLERITLRGQALVNSGMGVRSTIGGVLRLRSYVPLKGKGLKPAQGDCPNDLLRPADIQQPLRSAELSNFETLPIRKVYEYDIETVAGNNIICNLGND
jgi:hypothetical protein